MYRILAIFIFTFLPGLLLAQKNLYGKVIDAANGQAIAGASVFINNSSIGTVTNAEGAFELKAIPEGQYELIISSIGYETNLYSFHSNQLPLRLRIEMNIKIRELENVIIEPSVLEGWDKWGDMFMKNFIGRTSNGAKCKIKNYKKIRFRYFKKSNRVIAFCDEPLKIENPALGYIVNFQLEHFEVNFQSGVSQYYGYPYFEEIDKNRRSLQRKWKEARDKAYYGSITHFMKSLYTQALSQNNFEIRGMKRVANVEKQRVRAIYRPPTSFFKGGPSNVSISISGNSPQKNDSTTNYATDSAEYYQRIMRQPDTLEIHTPYLLSEDSILVPGADDYKVLHFADYLYITYKGAFEEESYVATLMERRKPAFQRSYITLVGEEAIAVFANGNYWPPQALFNRNYWSWTGKLADMLPMNFIPSSKE